MNLFVTSSDPEKSAENLDDRRLIKSILETALMLSTALRKYGKANRALYGSTHAGHPVTRWIMKNRGNYEWALAYFKAACEEYTKRFGKTHKSCALTKIFTGGKTALPPGARKAFQNSARNVSIGLDFTNLPPLKAYQAYLAAKWDKEEPRWTNRGAPGWYKRKAGRRAG